MPATVASEKLVTEKWHTCWQRYRVHVKSTGLHNKFRYTGIINIFIISHEKN